MQLRGTKRSLTPHLRRVDNLHRGSSGSGRIRRGPVRDAWIRLCRSAVRVRLLLCRTGVEWYFLRSLTVRLLCLR